MKRISKEDASFHIKLDTEDGLSLHKAVAFTLTPCLEEGMEEWEDVTYYGESIFDASGAIKKPEWVYVLVNKSMPGICKIGMTTTSVSQRVSEINSATGVITPWFPVYSYKCVNSRYLEQAVHKYLEDKGHRVNPNREGFELDSNTAIKVIEELGVNYQTDYYNQNLHT
jgi:hypothetical protein